MKSDEQLLAHVANLTEIQDGSRWKNRRPGPPPDYFKTLTRRQVEDLYRRYQADFELFGYSIDDYLDTARQVWSLGAYLGIAYICVYLLLFCC